jgi:hypothetical protein
MSSLACCLTLRRPSLRSGGQTRPSSKYGSSKNGSISDSCAECQKIDLVSNEGANLQDDLWKLCFRAKLEDAHPREYQFYRRLSGTLVYSSYEFSLQALEKRYSQHGLARHIPKIRSLLSTLQPFTAAISTMVQAHPNVAALVWGSIQVVLEVSFSVCHALLPL